MLLYSKIVEKINCSAKKVSTSAIYFRNKILKVIIAQRYFVEN